MNGNYIIVTFLRRFQSGLENTVKPFLPGKGAERLSRSNSEQRVEAVCQVFGARCAALWCTLSAFSALSPKPLNIISPGQNQRNPFQICSLPLVPMCLLTWLHSAISFLKGLACFAGYVLVPFFKCHVFLKESFARGYHQCQEHVSMQNWTFR